MGSCCDSSCSIEGLQGEQRTTLIKVLWINALMFFVIAAAAFYGNSTALLSDSLDNLGDAVTYGLSLFVLSKSMREKARVALFKGGLIFLAASLIVVQILYKLNHPEILPSFEIMGIFSLAGVAANGLSLWLLWGHRDDDINMSSVFECSKNDIISNLSVFVAAGAVWLLDSGWPDIVIASLLVVMLLRSSARVIQGALTELKT